MPLEHTMSRCQLLPSLAFGNNNNIDMEKWLPRFSKVAKNGFSQSIEEILFI
jgi:hypothetical protein